MSKFWAAAGSDDSSSSSDSSDGSSSSSDSSVGGGGKGGDNRWVMDSDSGECTYVVVGKGVCPLATYVYVFGVIMWCKEKYNSAMTIIFP